MATISLKFVLFLTAIASTCLVLGNESADFRHFQEEMSLKERYKRASRMVTAYSLGTLDACQDIGSAGVYCGYTYKIPAVIARFAGQLAKDEKIIISALTNNPKLPVNQQCKTDIKNFLCNAFYPVCNSANKTVTYNLRDCAKTGLTCPKSIYDAFHRTSCKNIPSGTYASNKCVKPLTTDTKVCRKPNANAKVPQWLIHEDQLNDNSAQNLQKSLKKQNASASCIQKMTQFICGVQPFCSTDEKYILTTGYQQQCYDALHCLPPKAQLSLKKLIDCTLLPNATTAKRFQIPFDSAIVSGAYTFSYNAVILWSLVASLVLHLLN
ncbi:hypothetical protein TrispH2_004609 [Trichoplax sp. H2]|nr:hypothetical protein TrispH2_004609 [Trichoplax sp. H2]|eukprot:RDD44210.1 hypothetical protein TrispH2_004609 [Trichoplax sp. H2]